MTTPIANSQPAHGRPATRLVDQITIAQAIDHFLTDTPLAPRTIGAYRTALRRFADHLAGQGLDPTVTPTTALNHAHIVAWAVAHAPPRPRTPAAQAAQRTVRTYLAGIRHFYASLVTRQLVAHDDRAALAQQLRSVLGRQPPSRPPRVRGSDLHQLLDAALALPTHGRPAHDLYRLKAIALLAMLRSTGLRVSELCRLTRAAVDLGQGTAVVTTTRHGPRTVRLDPETVAHLAAYWTARGDDQALSPDQRTAFAGHDLPGRPPMPISPRTVQALIARLRQAAGLTTAVTPHSFRHALALDLVRGRVHEPTVQRLLGHARAATTHHYVELVDTELETDR